MRLTPSWLCSSSAHTVEEQSVDGDSPGASLHTIAGVAGSSPRPRTNTATARTSASPSTSTSTSSGSGSGSSPPTDRDTDTDTNGNHTADSTPAAVPDSDEELLALLADMRTPVTVDELVDRLVHNADQQETAHASAVQSTRTRTPSNPSAVQQSQSTLTFSSTPPTPPSSVPIETWATIHEHLHQKRLPALNEAGSITFDPERGLVELPETTADEQSFSPPLLGPVLVGLLFLFVALASASVLTAVTLTVAATTFAVWMFPVYGLV